MPEEIQFGLFDPPIARADDPNTSKRAAQEHTMSGKRETNAMKVLTFIRRHPGLTSREIAAGVEIDGAWKRVSDLHKKGKIKKTGVRVCSVTGKQARTWMASEGEVPF